MKSLTRFIQEKLIINSLQEKLVIKKSNQYKYFPQTKEELKDIILQRIKNEGNKVDLNDIDVSKITNMVHLFKRTNFNGDISQWDVSNVADMHGMFSGCKTFNRDISQWDVSNVTNMSNMFYNCKSFNKDISKWDVSNVTDMSYMFYNCNNFNKDISQWDVSSIKYNSNIFSNCLIEEKYKPNFK